MSEVILAGKINLTLAIVLARLFDRANISKDCKFVYSLELILLVYCANGATTSKCRDTTEMTLIWKKDKTMRDAFRRDTLCDHNGMGGRGWTKTFAGYLRVKMNKTQRQTNQRKNIKNNGKILKERDSH